jgi:transcriptional repressor NrdR
MRCPSCGHVEDKVVDSRASNDGEVIRRRRECLACGNRSTTFERIELAPLVVTKRDGSVEPFEAGKIVAGVLSASKHRPISAADAGALADAVEDALQCGELARTAEAVGEMVLERLQQLDHVAYLRFASVYKDFDDIADFEREAGRLSTAGPGSAEAN